MPSFATRLGAALLVVLSTSACGARSELLDLGNAPDSGAPDGGQAPFDVRRMALGYTHICVLLDGGQSNQVRCWGMNGSGQLGDGTTQPHAAGASPTDISGAVDIDSGSSHTCSVHIDGTARCWGYNGNGVLGSSSGGTLLVPTVVADLPSVVQISTEAYHTCARTQDGRIYCWGENNYGQLGAGSTTSGSATPVQVVGIENAIHVTVGERHTCALLGDATVRCWGDGSYGELGNGTFDPSSLPVQPQGLCPVAFLDAGGFRTCAVCTDGTVQCFGDNENGPLLPDAPPHVPLPAVVPGLSGITQISTDLQLAYALKSDGTVFSWGLNSDGALGDGSKDSHATALPVKNATDVLQVMARETPTGRYGCIRRKNRDIQCTGNTKYGQLGATGEKDTTLLTPVEW